MTENEAIKRIIKSACASKKCHDACLYGEGNCEYDAAIIALKEIQQYREIGTVEECREAVEKQKPKEPTVLKQQHSDFYNCPKCGRNLILKCGTDWFGGQHYKSCPNCGQAIQWENLEGMEDD